MDVMPNRSVYARVSLKAIRQNVREIRSKVRDGVKFCAVVKGDAYGHGAIAVAKAAVEEGADYLAVAILEEAVELRKAGFLEPILILGHTPLEQLCQVVEYDLEQTIFTMEAACALSAAALRMGKKAWIHIKIDTGMRRIGVLPEQAGSFASAVAALPGIEIRGMFSHFATADEKDKSFAFEQLRLFQEALQRTKAQGVTVPIKHIANSAAILEIPEAQFDMVRAGIILYGLWPSEEVRRTINLQPAMQLCARVAFIKTVPSERGISYGQTFRTCRESRIATLPIGYADGWTRLLSGKANVWIGNAFAPVVGKICMDQCMVDVTNINGVECGDEAVLFGSKELPVGVIADWLGTIHYEIVCMVGKRVPRIYE